MWPTYNFDPAWQVTKKRKLSNNKNEQGNGRKW